MPGCLQRSLLSSRSVCLAIALELRPSVDGKGDLAEIDPPMSMQLDSEIVELRGRRKELEKLDAVAGETHDLLVDVKVNTMKVPMSSPSDGLFGEVGDEAEEGGD